MINCVQIDVAPSLLLDEFLHLDSEVYTVMGVSYDPFRRHLRFLLEAPHLPAVEEGHEPLHGSLTLTREEDGTVTSALNW